MADYNSSLPVRTENDGDIVSKISDGSNTVVVNADGSLNVNANVTGTVSVSSVDLDIRDLDATQDNVAISDGSDTLEINADGSINVNTSITGTVAVSATDFDIRDISATQDNIAISDGSDTLEINADGSVNVNASISGTVAVSAVDLDIRDLDATQDNVAISDGVDTLAINTDGSVNVNSSITGTVAVSAVDLDIRNLSAAQDNVAAWIKDEAGNAFTEANPLPVYISESEGLEINDYKTVSVTASATNNHDYTTSGSFYLTQVYGTGSGKAKIEVMIEQGAGSGTFDSKFVQFNSTANPNMEVWLREPISVPSGFVVRVAVSNRDNQPQDVYSTICGHY